MTMWRGGTVLVAVLTAVLAACTGDSGDGPERVRAGHQVEAIAGYLTTPTRFFRTPQGRWNVRVGAPRAAVVDARSGQTVHAPEGGRFVEVELEAGPTAPAPLRSDDQFPAVRLSLVTDGRRYPVDLDALQGAESDDDLARQVTGGALPYGAAYVAVAGNARDLTVRVDQDGVRQTLDPRTGRRDPGGAAGLYTTDPRAVSFASCGSASAPKRFDTDFRPCTIDARRAYWLGGEGYAPRGRAWLVTQVDIGTNTGVEVRGSDEVFSLSTAPELSFRYSRGPVTAVGLRAGPGSPGAENSDEDVFVVSVPADADAGGTLRITATYSLRALTTDRPPKGAEDGTKIPLVWTVTLR